MPRSATTTRLWLTLMTLTLLLSACGGGGAGGGAANTPQAGQSAAQASVCVVPKVVGFDQTNAERMVQGVGLVPVRSAEFSASVPQNQVISQKPDGGTRLDPCKGEVSIVVSLGGAAATATPIAVATTVLSALERNRAAIVGTWAPIQNSNGNVSAGDNITFYSDGKVRTLMGNRVSVGTYDLTDESHMTIAQKEEGSTNKPEIATVQFSLSDNRMTWTYMGSTQEFERIGSTSGVGMDATAIATTSAAILNAREAISKAIIGEWRPLGDATTTLSFHSNGTVVEKHTDINVTRTRRYAIISNTEISLETTVNSNGATEMQTSTFVISGDRMTWTIRGSTQELERIGPAN